MNGDGDRRVRRTRRLLHDAFTNLVLEKGYDRMTVQDILDRADVGRSTFYAHFRDKEALLMSCFDELRTGLHEGLRDNDRGNDWDNSAPDPAGAVFYHAHRHRRVYKALCGKKGGNVVHRHLSRLIGDAVRRRLEPQLAAAGSDLPAEVVAEYYASATLGLLMWWVERDFAGGPERMARMQQRLIAPGLLAALDPAAPITPATGAERRSAPRSTPST
ncbi:MAG TPA: TetR/AcrR family transcriptional regulator [Candidatus Limnocylindrales bacterium]|nr:TetR/AcrR family transcriptional regulator [Candidatus Limnocylindrales bacterium]